MEDQGRRTAKGAYGLRRQAKRDAAFTNITCADLIQSGVALRLPPTDRNLLFGAPRVLSAARVNLDSVGSYLGAILD
jgi:hypothetical protein